MPRKRKLTPEQKEKRRQYKRNHRAKKGPEWLKAKRKADMARCVDLELLKSYSDVREDGCWVWRGPFERVYNKVKPVVRRGYGKMYADWASFEAKFGRRPKRRCFPKAKCGTEWCIAPEHLYETNMVLEKVLKARAIADGLDQSTR